MFNHLIASGNASRKLWTLRTTAASVAFHGALLLAVGYASVAVHEEVTRIDDKVVLMDIDAFVPPLPVKEERLPTTRTAPPADARPGPQVLRRTPSAAETTAPPSPPSELPGLEELLAASSTPIPGGLEFDGMEGIRIAEEATAPPVLALDQTEFIDYESFAAFVIAPQIRNTGEMRTFLTRHYQPILEFTGATGVVQLHFWIDEKGGVARAEIASSSGSRSLDRLAMRVSRILRFVPAMRLGRPVRVLVRLPITFREVSAN